MLRSTNEICQRLIDTHKDRIRSKNESYLTASQRQIYKAVTDLVETTPGQPLKCSDIRKKYKGSLLPSDFSYNRVNIAPDSEIKFLLLRERGIYEFVGFNWETTDEIKITWSPNGSDELRRQTFTVGYYRHGRYEWDFDQIRELLSGCY